MFSAPDIKLNKKTLQNEIKFLYLRVAGAKESKKGRKIIENVLFLISSHKFPCDCGWCKDELFYFPGYGSNRSEN